MAEQSKPGSGNLNRLIQSLAVAQHNRMVRELQAGGYKWGPKHDKTKKLSPWLAPWHSLNEQIKKEYMAQAAKIPDIVDEAGYALVSAGAMTRLGLLGDAAEEKQTKGA